MLSERDVLEYLGFLGDYARGLLLKKAPKDDDLRALNLEVNKFLERLRESPVLDERLLGEIGNLKVDYDESRPPRRAWGAHLIIYGTLSWFPGSIVVWAKDKSEAAQRKRMLSEFMSRIATVTARVSGADADSLVAMTTGQEKSDSPTIPSWIRFVAFVIIMATVIILLVRG
jgi:hypothetical protein